MEQKRTLWITAAVGLFLLVVLGAAMILYAPASNSGQFAFSPNTSASSSNGWISLAPSPAVPGTPYNQNSQEDEPFNFEKQDKPASEFRTDEVTIFAENATLFSDNAVVSAENANFPNVTPPVASSESQKPQQTIINNTTTIDLSSEFKDALASAQKAQTQVASSKAEPKKNVASKSESSTKKSDSAVTKKNQSVAQNQKSYAVKTTGTTVAKTASSKSTASEAPVITQYWVQVTALTSRKSADAARSVLDENQITADVFTYSDAKNRLFYRVRVGPYTTKSEAEYWRSRISKIDTFKNTASYVTSTQVVN